MELREVNGPGHAVLRTSLHRKRDRAGWNSALYPLSAGRMVFVNPLDCTYPAARAPVLAVCGPARRANASSCPMTFGLLRMLAPASLSKAQSLILLAREAIGLALAAEEQGARLFQQGVQTDLALTDG